MTADSPIWAPNPAAEEERENRINLALLRGVMENLRANRNTVPLFALAVAAMFAGWVRLPWMALWYVQVLAGLAPQLWVLHHFPKGELNLRQQRRWTIAVTVSNLFFVACWTSLGWYLWVPGNEYDHLLIAVVLGATLAAHCTLVGPSRQVAVPAFALYGAVMALVPLQAHTVMALFLAACTPFYAWYIATVARQHCAHARAAIVVAEERNALLAELVMAKLESDRGRDRAEAASLAKSHFLANMSHELRTPLNAILGFSELISTRIFADNPDRNYEYAGLIHSSGKHLLALINDILDLAKIEAGRWQLEEAELDLFRMAEDAIQFVLWRARDAGASVDNIISPEIELLYADERAVKQVLLNLLSNAVKFTPANGQVTTFAYRDEQGGLVFGVSDTGVGIAAEDQDRVFDSFGQGKHDIALVDKGTGLGLAIVKGLAESHGAQITLQSEVGKGTRVAIHMPAARLRSRAGTRAA